MSTMLEIKVRGRYNTERTTIIRLTVCGAYAYATKRQLDAARTRLRMIAGDYLVFEFDDGCINHDGSYQRPM